MFCSTQLGHGRRGWEASSRARSAQEAPGLTSSIFSGAYRRRCHLSGGGGWGVGTRVRHCTCLQTPAARRGSRAHGGREGSRRPGAGGPPLPARGPPRREAEEDAGRPRKLCPSPQGSSPRTCSPVCPIPARVGEGRGVRDAEEERREKRGGATRAPPPPHGCCAQAQWPLPQAGGGNMAE